MDHLEKLESQSVYILREAYANFKNLAMLWSIGKDSTVLLWLARKAFFGHVPFPLVHILTCCKYLKSEALKHTLSGDWPRVRMDHEKGQYVPDTNTEPYTGVIVGARADEERLDYDYQNYPRKYIIV